MELYRQEISQDRLNFFIDYIEEIKDLLSSRIWENIFLNCSKNEVLVFWLLYRRNEVNMTEISEYIHVPLNTATGIITRMEKNGLITRSRSKEDKRVVLIKFSEKGMSQFQELVGELMACAVNIFDSLTEDEMALFYKMANKVKDIFKQAKKREEASQKAHKIVIK